MESGLSRKGDFRRDQYDFVAQAIDAETIYNALHELYGSAPDTPNYDEVRDHPLDDRVAYQFAFIHQRVLAEAQGQTEEASPEVGDQ